MGYFSIDIEKYHEELSSMGRQLKGIFCIQYPIYCIHSEISDSTPDALDNLDKVIVDFLKIKPDFTSFQIGSIIGASKSLVDLRIKKLVFDKLLCKDGGKCFLSEEGTSVFETKIQLRQHKLSYDFYVDGITLKPLSKVFYNYYKNKLISENHTYCYTNQEGETKTARPFAPDIVHTPPDKSLITNFIMGVETGKRDEFGIPLGLQSIDDISYTKMSFQILISVSKSKDGMIKEFADGFAIYSLSEELSYYETVRKNVSFFEPTLKEKIQNLEFKIMMPFQKKDSQDKPVPYLTTNWPEIDRYKDSHNKCFNFSSEDLIKFLAKTFELKHIEQESVINEDDTIEFNINKKTLSESSNRQKLVNGLIRKRDYKIFFNNSLERNVFLFYLYYRADDPLIIKLIEFVELIKIHKKVTLSFFSEKHIEYLDKYRSYLVLAGEFDLLEKLDVEKHMSITN